MQNLNKKLLKYAKSHITSEQLSMIKKHADEDWNHYENKNARDENTIKEHIIRGKIAEFAYYNLCKHIGIENITFPNVNNKNGDDGGYDIVVNGVKVDIKSLEENSMINFKRIPLNPSLRADAYVLLWVNINEGYAIYEGAITTKEIREKNLLIKAINKTSGSIYWYVDKRYLKELNENFI